MGKRTALLLLFPAVLAAAPGWTLIGWNDLGMHCMDGDFTVFSILPPYNNIHAQLIDPSGHLVRNAAGVTVTYEAAPDASGSINTTSAWKTRFWDFAHALFGVSPAPDAGLAGSNMPGPNNTPQPMRFEPSFNWFTAEGVPVTNWDDAGNKNPYPMMRLVARDGSGGVLAETKIVLPVSDEMDCGLCHGSGARGDTRPSRGWANASLRERDYKLNILALHDDRAGTSLRASAGGGVPVLCASCHGSNALAAPGQPGRHSLTQAIHSSHAAAVEQTGGGRSACYRCHPGSETRCLRGAMGSAMAADGTAEMQCQSCHGNMASVGSGREGWLDQPACQQCHTGTAVRNSGAIRFTSVFDSFGQRRAPADARFATNADVPAAGYSLYRFSTGHGGLACEACHGSTHAEYPSSHDNDNVQSVALQGHAGALGECGACHASLPQRTSSGPHGMHPVGQSWVNAHGDAAEGNRSQCQDCHGTDYRGTVLSRAFGARTLSAFGTKQLWRGYTVGCYLCHAGPSSEHATSNRAPVASDATAGTRPSASISLALNATDPDGQGLSRRVVSAPRHGTVAMSGSSAIYTPDANFEGEDAFSWAAWDGSAESNLATARITVRAETRPVFTSSAVVNAANYQGGGVSPGEMVTIFGHGVGPDAIALAETNSAGLLSRSVGNTRVLFDGIPAPLLYAMALQTSAVVPYGVAGKAATSVQVEYNGIRSEPVSVNVVPSAPGIFSRSMQGTGQGAILNEDGYTANSPEAPAPRGSVVSIYATGEGMTDRNWIDGAFAYEWAHPLLPVKVRIGGLDAEVWYAGSAPYFVTGFTQINAKVPDNVTPGDAVPVLVIIGSAQSQPGLTMSVR